MDALRGFAVMAIVLVHNLEHFIYPVYPTDAPAWLGTLDRIVLDGTFSLFAVVSIVLLITRNWSDRAIFITAVIFLLQPVEWFHCIAALINPGHTLPDLHVAEMYAEAAEYTKAGEPWAFFLGNITLGQKASLL